MLLVALLATFFFAGIAAPGDGQRIIGSALVAVTMMLALYAGELAQRYLRLAFVVVVVLVAGVVIASVAGNDRTAGAIAGLTNALMVAVAPLAVVTGVWRSIRETGAVTLTVVAGVLCFYVLVGLWFAFVYTAIQNIDAAPFFAGGVSATAPRSVYFSFVTLATLGYGDYTARTNFGHTLSITEALLGQIYLVTVVATIIGRLVPRRFAPDE